MTRMVNRTGMQYGYLTVLGLYHRRNKAGRVIWRCECKCGSKVIVVSQNLQGGNTRSCGCLRSETNSKKVREEKKLEQLELLKKGA